MKVLLLSILLWLQGIPLQPSQTGTITGVLRTEDGKPAAGVRVAAMPQLDSLQGDAGPTLSSLAETNAEGRFTLENVPPGRYYIAAGRLDLPTFYPGTQSMALGKSVQVTPGAMVRNIEFSVNASSAGRADNNSNLPLALLEVPLNVSVEGGGKPPWYNGGQSVSIRLTGSSGTLSFPISATGFNLSPPVTDYAITMEGLPDGYSLKSIKYGTSELADRVLRLGGFPGVNGTVLFGNATSFVRSLKPPVLAITLTHAASTSGDARGHRVRGSTGATPRPLSLSGLSGTVFSDGSFEFQNVQPGRHILVTRNNSATTPALAAVVIVGDDDLEGVVLEATPTPVLPRNTLALSLPPGLRAPGTVPLVSVQGHILDTETGMPVRAGTVYLVGESWATYDLSADGKFEFKPLLPGTYEIEVQGVGYPTFRREIFVEEKDIDLELKAG